MDRRREPGQRKVPRLRQPNPNRRLRKRSRWKFKNACCATSGESSIVRPNRTRLEWLILGMSTPDENRNPSASREAAAPVVPNHRLLRRIGRGSYGEVWLALDLMDKWRAVKIVYSGAGGDRRSYEQEFRGLRRYDELSGNDGSLMPIKNVGENAAAGYFYYAMELADNAVTRKPLPQPPNREADLAAAELAASYRPWTLSEELSQCGRLPTQNCIEHGLALAQSLQVLHQGHLVHRDVKPSNIIFVNGRAKLADVGLVAAVDATMKSLAGTSGFVPLHGAGLPTGDIFALGKVLYMAATGNDVREFPHACPDVDKLGDEERQGLAELQAVYERACDPSPDDRQPTAQALRDELELLRRNESVVRLRQLEVEREAYLLRRKKWLLVSSVVAALGLVAAAALLVNWWRLRTAHAATVAELQAGQLTRMFVRQSGWSTRDWQKAEQAAAQKLDGNVIGQAVSTLSGLDGHLLAYWQDVEVSTVAFAPDGRALFAGYGNNHALLVTDATNQTALPVIGEGKACWTPDGVPLILQTASNHCVLREARTGAIRHEFPFAPGEGVTDDPLPATAVSPDGSLVAAGLTNPSSSRIVVWDAATGRVIGEAARAARALNFAPDGSLLATGDPLGRVVVWRVAPFGLVAELPPAQRPNPVNCLAFGEDRVVPRDGTRQAKRWLLAVGDSGANLTVWDLTKRVPRAFYAGSEWNVQSVAFSPDGVTLASGGRSPPILWDVMSGKQLLETAFGSVFASDTTALAFGSSGAILAAGCNANSHRAGAGLLEVLPHRGVQRLRGLRGPVRKVWFSRDSKLLAALSDDWSLPVWEVATGRLRYLFEVPAGELADNAGGAFDATGRRFGFATGGAARLYDLETGHTLGDWALPHGFGEETQFDPSGRLLLVRREPSPEHPHRNWRWTLYELPPGATPVVLRRQEDLSYRSLSMAFPAPGSRVLVITKDWTTEWNSVRAFDVLTGVEKWQQEKVNRRPYELLQTDSGGNWCWFEVCDPERVCATQFLHISSGQTAARISGGARSLSPNGHEFATGNSANLLSWVLKRVDGNGPELVFGHDAIYSGYTHQFSPDGRHLAWGANGGEVFLANLAEVRRRLATLPHAEKFRP